MADSPFSAAVTSKAVHDTLDEALAVIPEGKHHALLVDATAQPGSQPKARALYVQRFEDGWNVALEGAWKGGPKVSGKVTVLKCW